MLYYTSTKYGTLQSDISFIVRMCYSASLVGFKSSTSLELFCNTAKHFFIVWNIFGNISSGQMCTQHWFISRKNPFFHGGLIIGGPDEALQCPIKFAFAKCACQIGSSSNESRTIYSKKATYLFIGRLVYGKTFFRGLPAIGDYDIIHFFNTWIFALESLWRLNLITLQLCFFATQKK